MDNKILLVGEDFHLLASRAAVLSKTGANVTCCSSSEFATHLGNEEYSLVVLCHSLQQDVASRIVKQAHERWAAAKVLRIFSGYDRPATVPANVDASAMAEPARLLEHVSQLLRPSA